MRFERLLFSFPLFCQHASLFLDFPFVFLSFPPDFRHSSIDFHFPSFFLLPFSSLIFLESRVEFPQVSFDELFQDVVFVDDGDDAFAFRQSADLTVFDFAELDVGVESRFRGCGVGGVFLLFAALQRVDFVEDAVFEVDGGFLRIFQENGSKFR